MAEIRTAIPEEVDAYLDALVQKGLFFEQSRTGAGGTCQLRKRNRYLLPGVRRGERVRARRSIVSGRVRPRICRAGRHGGGHRLRGRSSARGGNPRKVEALARRKENPVAWRAFGSRVRRSCRRRGARRG